MSDIMKDSKFKELEEKLTSMRKRASEFAQSRSRFQIEKFIAEEEYTPITKYRHVAHNSYICLQEVLRLFIERERINREIIIKNNKTLKDKQFNNYDLDLYELNMRLTEIDIKIKGLLSEISIMENICDKLEKENGKPFTNEQLQSEEPIYWEKRYARQIHENMIASRTGITDCLYRGYIQSITNPILEDGMKVDPYPFNDFNVVSSIALSGIKGVDEIFLTKKEDKCLSTNMNQKN